MDISPDSIIYWEWQWITINATLVNSWITMFILAIGSFIITRNLTSGTEMGRGQNMLEVIVLNINEQIEEVTHQDASIYLPFIGTLFLFIVAANILSIIPGYNPPTGSLTTTAALAACVFIAVPYFGIKVQGAKTYFQQYIKPTPIMLPFNIIGELSRTLALAVRLFGNIMSGTLTAAILLSLAPLFFPILIQAFGLLIGVIQAYVFAILALVYIASATRVHTSTVPPNSEQEEQTETKS
ncbi:MAG: F0F1 ATP synthase subunit A [Bacteroidota bacterium]